ncbi:hypothetical protein GCM10009668_22660 [Nocardioides dubius]|uniref:Uncharacterized protein n=1 Tax=Nocardioides dubius TaxID=317019 RepID=A0ABN1TUP0_9ACTN
MSTGSRFASRADHGTSGIQPGSPSEVCDLPSPLADGVASRAVALGVPAGNRPTPRHPANTATDNDLAEPSADMPSTLVARVGGSGLVDAGEVAAC